MPIFQTVNLPASITEDLDEAVETMAQPLQLSDDPLALSWASYRCGQSSGTHYQDLTSITALPQDHEQARATRLYYRNRCDRVLVQSLQAKQTKTKFDLFLYAICKEHSLTSEHLGALYQLPYFYIEDTTRDNIRRTVTSQPNDSPGTMTTGHSRCLSRIASVYRKRRYQRHVVEYWFHDQSTGHAVKWEVDYMNPLRGLIEHHWNCAPHINLHACWRSQYNPHMQLAYWSVVPKLKELWIE